MRVVLIHGGTVGAWSWERLAPELEARGHEVVTPELPGSGARVNEKATLDGYRDTVLDVMQDGDVLVGHSMGGHTLTVAAAAAPERVAHAIYFAAGVPAEGKPMAEATPLEAGDMSAAMEMCETPHGPGFTFRREALRDLFYGDCSDDVFEWAASQHTAQELAPLTTPIHAEGFWTSSIPRDFILCTLDRAAINYSADLCLERLGLDQAYLLVGPHMAPITHPAATAEVIDRILARRA